jgi:hypothetical protein
MISNNPAFVDILPLIVSVLMVLAGATQERFRRRTVEFAVRRHPRSSCSSRWP